MGLDELRRRKSTAAVEEDKLRKAMEPKAELVDLLEEIPNTLDDLLNRIFPNARHVDTKESAKRFGYTSLINDRPVDLRQHQRLCRSLLLRLRNILAWCENPCCSVLDQRDVRRCF